MIPPVTTRTTTLVSTPHTSFHLRFSDLIEVEEACREDEEQRAIRTIDWMTARIGKRCAKWVQDVELAGDRETFRTPWWDELRRCSEGDFVPSRTESWNHPVAGTLGCFVCSFTHINAICSHTRRFDSGAKSVGRNHRHSCPHFAIPFMGRHQLSTIHSNNPSPQFPSVR